MSSNIKYKKRFIGNVNGKQYDNETAYNDAIKQAEKSGEPYEISCKYEMIPEETVILALPGFGDMDHISMCYSDNDNESTISDSVKKLIETYKSASNEDKLKIRQVIKHINNNIGAIEFKTKGKIEEYKKNIDTINASLNSSNDLLGKNSKYKSIYQNITKQLNDITPETLVEDTKISNNQSQITPRSKSGWITDFYDTWFDALRDNLEMIKRFI